MNDCHGSAASCGTTMHQQCGRFSQWLWVKVSVLHKYFARPLFAHIVLLSPAFFFFAYFRHDSADILLSPGNFGPSPALLLVLPEPRERARPLLRSCVDLKHRWWRLMMLSCRCVGVHACLHGPERNLSWLVLSSVTAASSPGRYPVSWSGCHRLLCSVWGRFTLGLSSLCCKLVVLIHTETVRKGPENDQVLVDMYFWYFFGICDASYVIYVFFYLVVSLLHGYFQAYELVLDKGFHCHSDLEMSVVVVLCCFIRQGLRRDLMLERL